MTYKHVLNKQDANMADGFFKSNSLKQKFQIFLLLLRAWIIKTGYFAAITDNFSSTCKNMLSKFIKLLSVVLR